MQVFLETERLILRQFTVDDAQKLFALDSDPEVMRFINGGKPTAYDIIQQQTLPRFLAYYEQYEGYGFWAAIEKSSHEFIGWFHFRPALDNADEIDLGYRLRQTAWGKGYATEGARALIHKGFTELGAQRIVATALAGNKGSIRVMEKAGLTFEKRYMYDEAQEAVKYAINREDFGQFCISPREGIFHTSRGYYLRRRWDSIALHLLTIWENMFREALCYEVHMLRFVPPVMAHVTVSA